MNNEIFFKLYNAACADKEKDAFVSDWALSSIWGDNPESEVPVERIEILSDIWTAAHRSIKDIAADAGLSLRQLAYKYAIPQRTIEDWSSGRRTPPPYVLLLIQQAAGIFYLKE